VFDEARLLFDLFSFDNFVESIHCVFQFICNV